ncbi:MAG TPA: hypothetical protein VJA21_14810, partial [Verrucomicrobiae bacterium]
MNVNGSLRVRLPPRNSHPTAIVLAPRSSATADSTGSAWFVPIGTVQAVKVSQCLAVQVAVYFAALGASVPAAAPVELSPIALAGRPDGIVYIACAGANQVLALKPGET